MLCRRLQNLFSPSLCRTIGSDEFCVSRSLPFDPLTTSRLFLDYGYQSIVFLRNCPRWTTTAPTPGSSRIKSTSCLPRTSHVVRGLSLFHYPYHPFRFQFRLAFFTSSLWCWVCVRSANGVICTSLLREGRSRVLLLYTSLSIVVRCYSFLRFSFSFLLLPLSSNYISPLVVHIPVSLQQLLSFLLSTLGYPHSRLPS